MAERTCIVTRRVHDPDALIRFVAAPDGTVVADLKRNLPGRGVWIGARRSLVEQAVEKSLFSRGLKTQANADGTLPERVDARLRDTALASLGFARKAGQCITGSSKVEAGIRNGRAIAVLHATDGADDGLRKLRQAIFSVHAETGHKIALWRVFTTDEMTVALGAANVIHVALMEGGASRNCMRQVARLAAYRELETEDEPSTVR